YMQLHGSTVAGKKIELIVKDDGGVPDNSKRIAQELIVGEKVAVVGAGITPSAFAIAPLATQAKIATVVMVSGTSVVAERSPYLVRTSFYRPNFISVGCYDGMHVIYEALKKTGGKTDGDALVAAMKGMKWESPRGPISIDPETRDIIQNIYVRKVEKVGGELYNIELATFETVKDPLKVAKKK
ncbi:MAG: ABC transporter substrate-binding protein, partial [Bauldia sp.]